MTEGPRGPLEGVRVLDLSRILAGPTATQLLGDLGADVIKVERPRVGDDTRRWGPPFVPGTDEAEGESTYFLAANRNKRSITIDLARPEGAALVRRLAARSDVLVENYKVGDLARYGLDWPRLSIEVPGLVYCSITGFGQTGPRAAQTGYDFLAQAMGGVMSLTGPPDGEPTKVGVGVADVMCGMYAAVAILAALRHKERTGEGQQIDLALFDAQLAWMINAATATFATGEPPPRLGNGHPQIVPYQTFAAADGDIALAIGNDAQFARLCEVLGARWLADEPRFATNAARVRQREALVSELAARIATRERGPLIAALTERGVPAGAVQDVAEAFADPQAVHRGMRIALPHPRAEGGTVGLVGNPLKLEKTPVSYRRRPPGLGADTDEVLEEVLQLSAAEIAALRADKIV